MSRFATTPTPATFQIVPLANVPAHAGTLAAWLYDEWPEAFQRHTGAAQQRMGQRCNTDRLPLALVALAQGEPAGTVSLCRDRPPPLWCEIEPWVPTLSGLFVPPPWRGRGIATALCQAAVGLGRELGCRALFLYTQQPAFYQRLGWQVFDVQTGCLWMACESNA